MDKVVKHCTKWGREVFLSAYWGTRTLPTFWAERILILIIFICLMFGFQILGFPDSRLSAGMSCDKLA